MLPKTNRFSFKERLPQKIYSTPFFVVRYDKNALNKLSCAIVVGKKVDKKAVVRNKIKRRLLELIDEVFNRDAPFTVVIFVRKAIKEAEPEELKEEFYKLFDTLNK